MSVAEQIITNKNGKALAVQIPITRYKKLLQLAEEMEDIKAYDKAMKRKHKFTSFSQAVNEIKAERK